MKMCGSFYSLSVHTESLMRVWCLSMPSRNWNVSYADISFCQEQVWSSTSNPISWNKVFHEDMLLPLPISDLIFKSAGGLTRHFKIRKDVPLLAICKDEKCHLCGRLYWLEARWISHLLTYSYAKINKAMAISWQDGAFIVDEHNTCQKWYFLCMAQETSALDQSTEILQSCCSVSTTV